MCTGRVDLSFILRAFANGKDGVFIGGCWPGECHYITEGNYLALSNMHLCRKMLEMIGVNPQRLRLEWISASEGSRYAEVMNDFSNTLRELGPLGSAEGEMPDTLKQKIDALQQLVPYIKLVERERLRVPEKSVEAYNAFFASSEFERIFQELIVEKFEICQLVALLREKPRSSKELSELLGVPPSEVSVHLTNSARQGFIEFDASQNRYMTV
jgi:NADH-quinone oxidoreductase subunit E